MVVVRERRELLSLLRMRRLGGRGTGDGEDPETPEGVEHVGRRLKVPSLFLPGCCWNDGMKDGLEVWGASRRS